MWEVQNHSTRCCWFPGGSRENRFLVFAFPVAAGVDGLLCRSSHYLISILTAPTDSSPPDSLLQGPSWVIKGHPIAGEVLLLGVSVRGFLEEISCWIYRVKKTCLHQCGQASANPRKAQLDKRLSHQKLSLPFFKLGHQSCPDFEFRRGLKCTEAAVLVFRPWLWTGTTPSAFLHLDFSASIITGAYAL